MTQRIEITNLSNWDSENYEIVGKAANGEVYNIIKPGESLTFHPFEIMNIEIVPIEDESTQPFYNLEGAQVFPQNKTIWIDSKGKQYNFERRDN